MCEYAILKTEEEDKRRSDFNIKGRAIGPTFYFLSINQVHPNEMRLLFFLCFLPEVLKTLISF